MKWSQLLPRQKRLYIIVGLVGLAGLAIVINSIRQAGADISSNGVNLDSGQFDRTVAIQLTTVKDGAAAGAFLDVFDETGNGTLGETDDQGLGTVQLPAGCYKVQATDKNSPAIGSVQLVVGDATGCPAGAVAVTTANPSPITITLKES